MKVFAALLLIAVPAAAEAEVVSATAHGFEVSHSAELPLPPQAALAAFGKPAGWWGKDHTYSGDSANLSLALEPGGCFCERLPGGGGIEHLRVSYVDPGTRVVLSGALGPLLYEATSGVMDVQVKPAPGGSKLSLNYRAAGFFKGGADKLAPLVDKVLGEQVKRLGAYAAAQPKP